MQTVQCGSRDLPRTLKALKKSVHDVLVADNGVCYILLKDTLTPEARGFISNHGLIWLTISAVQYNMLLGNTPMNLRNAIQNKVVKREADTPDNIWNMLCKKAGIVEEPLTVTLSLLAQYTAAYALYVGMTITGAQL